MATRKSKCFQTGNLNLQEGAIFSRSLNDNRRMIMTGLYFIRFLTTFIVKKKHEPKSGKDEPKPNVSSEPRLTDISVNRGSPSKHGQSFNNTLHIFFIINNRMAN